MKFGKLIFRKMIKNFCHQMPDFRVKMHQKSISAYSAPPDPLPRFGRPTSKGREGRGESREWDRRGGEGRRRNRRAGEGQRTEGKEGGFVHARHYT